MTRKIFVFGVALIASAALAVPCFSADVTIVTTGKSPSVVKTEITRAAQEVCREEMHDAGPLGVMIDQESCVRDAISTALATPAAKAVFGDGSTLKVSRN